MTFNTTYAVGNNLFARQCFVLGWCVWSADNDPEPIAGLDKVQTEYLRSVYVGPLYPEELKKAIQDRLDELGKESSVEPEVQATTQDLVDDATKAPDPWPATIKQVAYEQAGGVTLNLVTNEHHQQALSKLAIYYLLVCNKGMDVKGNRLIAFLMDNAFELTLRTEGPNGNFMSLSDCPVTAKSPTDPELFACGYGHIPYTD